jgi:hypothetical protein
MRQQASSWLHYDGFFPSYLFDCIPVERKKGEAMKPDTIRPLIAISLVIGFISACAPSQPAAQTTALANPTVSKAANNSSPQSGSQAASSTTQEKPIAPETNPVGDISDTQVFVNYQASNGGYSLDVPEGWARTTDGTNVRFDAQFDGVSVSLHPNSPVPAAAKSDPSVQAQINALRAFQETDVSLQKLPAGDAVRITGTANSDPDPVTGKQVRLDEEIFLFYKNGALAAVRLWAPQGADNVDQWKRMIESFRWS